MGSVGKSLERDRIKRNPYYDITKKALKKIL